LWIKEVHFTGRDKNGSCDDFHEHQGHLWERYVVALKRVTFENAKRVCGTEEFLKNGA
jgi:hypothetical protein